MSEKIVIPYYCKDCGCMNFQMSEGAYDFFQRYKDGGDYQYIDEYWNPPYGKGRNDKQLEAWRQNENYLAALAGILDISILEWVDEFLFGYVWKEDRINGEEHKSGGKHRFIFAIKGMFDWKSYFPDVFMHKGKLVQCELCGGKNFYKPDLYSQFWTFGEKVSASTYDEKEYKYYICGDRDNPASYKKKLAIRANGNIFRELKKVVDGCKDEFSDSKFKAELKNVEASIGNIDEMEVAVTETKDIHRFIKELVGVEASVLFFEKEMKSLYMEYEQYRIKSIFVRKKQKMEADKKNEDERREVLTTLQIIESEIKENDAFLSDLPQFDKAEAIKKCVFVCPVEPPKPVAPTIVQPSMPILEKANIFNAKKVEQRNMERVNEYNNAVKQNEEKERQYQESLQQYEIEKVNWEVKKQEYKVQMDNFIEAERVKFATDLEEEVKRRKNLSERLEKAKLDWTKKLEELSIQDNTDAYDEICTYSDISIVKEHVLKGEIEQIKECLLDCYKTRELYYRSKVVYGKYLKFPILATFLEYFETGRVNTLPEAYNLYESELRADLIIGKLDTIIEQLEEIKENQYMIYSTLTSIEKNTALLNDTLNKGFSGISSQLKTANAQLDNIAVNTALSAYYTERTAQYTERTALATAATAWLIALT